MASPKGWKNNLKISLWQLIYLTRGIELTQIQEDRIFTKEKGKIWETTQILCALVRLGETTPIEEGVLLSRTKKICRDPKILAQFSGS